MGKDPCIALMNCLYLMSGLSSYYQAISVFFIVEHRIGAATRSASRASVATIAREKGCIDGPGENHFSDAHSCFVCRVCSGNRNARFGIRFLTGAHLGSRARRQKHDDA